jgi:hypothetical protein
MGFARSKIQLLLLELLQRHESVLDHISTGKKWKMISRRNALDFLEAPKIL